MTAMDSVAAKLKEYEYLLKLQMQKIEELAAENERLKANSSAHQTLQAIYRNEAESSNTRVRAAQAALPMETPKLQSVPPVINVTDEVIIPLAEVIRLQRARADRMLLEPPYRVVSGQKRNGNGSDDDTVG
jgi:hypothetical protein